MKKLLFTLLITVFVTTFSTAQDKINWMTFEEALALQKKIPKKIMMDVYTVWCGPCKMLDKNTFHNKDLADYVNKNYYAVKFNAQGKDPIVYKDKTFSNPNYDPAKAHRRNGNHQLSRYLKIRAFPTIMFFDEEANVISPIQGYKTPQQLELFLKMFKEDKNKNMKTQEDFNVYYEAFKPEFKG